MPAAIDSDIVEYFRTPLEDDRVRLAQTRRSEFQQLHAIAGRPELWAQHPQQDRWKLEIFSAFFEAGLDNELGCYSITLRNDATSDSGALAGMTRFYGFDAAERAVRIGYTFIALEHWGTDVNGRVKALMLDHAFARVDRVYFDIGSGNLRSQKAVAKLGAVQHDDADDTRVFVLEKASYSSA